MCFRLWEAGRATWTEIEDRLSLDDVQLMNEYLDAMDEARIQKKR